MTRAHRDYDDIPGTYVFDGEQHRKGYALNMMCMTLNKPENREEFKADEATYCDRHGISPEQKTAVLDRDWLEMLRLGGNIYYIYKIGIIDGVSYQHVGGVMSGMTEAEFRQMMIDGGRNNG
jgi:protocatechuate 4,5-dioxygenase alpha chain